MNPRSDSVVFIGGEGVAPGDLLRLISRVSGRLAKKMSLAMSEAEEFVYAAFERVWRQIRAGKVHHRKALSQYLYRAAVHLAMRPPERRVPLDYLTLSSEPTQLAELIRAEQPTPSERRLARIRRAARALDPADRALLEHILAHPGQAGQITARIFGLSHVAFRVRRSRMLQRLRREMGIRPPKVKNRRCRPSGWLFQRIQTPSK